MGDVDWGIPDNRTAALLWDGLQGLGGKNAPTDRLADVLVARNGSKPAWMTKFFLKSKKDRQDMDKNGCPQNECTQNWGSRGWGARTPDPLIKSQLLYQLS